jgi:hypothetical protein
MNVKAKALVGLMNLFRFSTPFRHADFRPGMVGS